MKWSWQDEYNKGKQNLSSHLSDTGYHSKERSEPF